MAEIKSESVADFIPESPADFPRNMQVRRGSRSVLADDSQEPSRLS
jgi:hypothetical protein